MLCKTGDLQARASARLRKSEAGFNWLGMEKDSRQEAHRDQRMLRDIVVEGSGEDRLVATLALRLSELTETGEHAGVHAHQVTRAGLQSFLAVEKSLDQKLASVVQPTISPIIANSAAETGLQFLVAHGSPEGRCVAQLGLEAGKSLRVDYHQDLVYQRLTDMLALGVLGGVGGPAGAALAALGELNLQEPRQAASQAMLGALARTDPNPERARLAQVYTRLGARGPAVEMLRDLSEGKPASVETLVELSQRVSFDDNRRALREILEQVARGGVDATGAQAQQAQQALSQLGSSARLDELQQAVQGLRGYR